MAGYVVQQVYTHTGPSRLSKLVAEFLGTFVLTVVVCSVEMNSQPAGWFGIASTLMVMVYAFGKISGSHFNPAVTLGLLLENEVSDRSEIAHDVMDAIFYWLVQLIGGLAGACVAGSLVTSHMATGSLLTSNVAATFPHLGGPRHLGLNNVWRYDTEWWVVLLAEMLFTAMLVFVVMNTATITSNNYFGISIGFTINAAAVSIHSLSGAVLNPAVGFGIAMGSLIFNTDGDVGHAFMQWGLYLLGQLLGAVLAWCLFLMIRSEATEDVERQLYPTFARACIGRTWHLSHRAVAEFVGTYFLVLTVCLAVLGGDQLAIIGIACALMVMIYSLGDVSGGHFNPAVSTGVLVRAMILGDHRFTVVDYAVYFAAQIFGGWAASLTAWLLKGWPTGVLLIGNKGWANNSFTWGEMLGAEFLFTFFLVMVVICTPAIREETPLGDIHVISQHGHGLAIGFVILAGGMAVGRISGGNFNPAVSFAVAITAMIKGAMTGSAHFLLYWIVQLFAGALAGVVSLITHTPPQYQKFCPGDVESSEE